MEAETNKTSTDRANNELTHNLPYYDSEIPQLITESYKLNINNELFKLHMHIKHKNKIMATMKFSNSIITYDTFFDTLQEKMHSLNIEFGSISETDKIFNFWNKLEFKKHAEHKMFGALNNRKLIAISISRKRSKVDSSERRQTLISEAHMHGTTHLPAAYSINTLEKQYFWKTLERDCHRFVRNCATCNTSQEQIIL